MSRLLAVLLALPGTASECPARGRSLLQVGRQLPTAQSVIDKHFENVPFGGGSLRENLLVSHQATVECSAIDFSSFVGIDDPKVLELMKALHLTEYCGEEEGQGLTPNDPTCLAFWAGLKAHLELQETHDPVNYHYAIVNWDQNTPGHFASWGSAPVVNVTYTQGMAPTWSIADPNVVSGYAFCDIIVTVLRQNANQVRSATCGPTAWLAAVNVADPAGSIRKGLEIYWTGTLPELPAAAQPCEYISQNIPPGIIPYAPGQPGFGTQGSPLCTGNAVDCQHAKGMPSFQAGLQGMWAMVLSSAAEHQVADCHDQYWKTPSLLADPAMLHQDTTVAQQLDFCGASFDHPEACHYVTSVPMCEELPEAYHEKCYYLVASPGLTSGDITALQQWAGVGAPAHTSAEWEAFKNRTMSPGGRGYHYVEELASIGLDAKTDGMKVVSPVDRLTQAQKLELCNSPHGAVLFVNAGILQSSDSSQPFDQALPPSICNHWVYLEDCDVEHDIMTIWSWGSRLYNTQDSLENQICGGIPIPDL